MNNIINELENIIKENQELKTKITEFEINRRNWAMRERLYQSELSTIKNQLKKIHNAIQTTPHSHDEEYNKIAYQGVEEEITLMPNNLDKYEYENKQDDN